ncbi:hypothetical protein L596_027820 [Steinernema carpocapsae]|uniref:Uncharacterized protein n=1 Tax=Steinernema carpocapsae TaxID=34508 RepID=A0A4U5LWM8_STECR|nr:hypothetical protein L596_027820 [Steinernema carpocapsae]
MLQSRALCAAQDTFLHHLPLALLRPPSKQLSKRFSALPRHPAAVPRVLTSNLISILGVFLEVAANVRQMGLSSYRVGSLRFSNPSIFPTGNSEPSGVVPHCRSVSAAQNRCVNRFYFVFFVAAPRKSENLFLRFCHAWCH